MVWRQICNVAADLLIVINGKTNLPQIISKFQSLCYSVSLYCIVHLMNQIQNRSKFSAKWSSFWLLTIIIHYYVIIFINIKVFHVQMYLLCMCHVFQSNSSLVEIFHTEYHRSWLRPQVAESLLTTIQKPAFNLICDWKSTKDLQSQCSSHRLGAGSKNESWEKQGCSVGKTKVPSIADPRCSCVRRFLMMAAQSSTGTYSGMLDLTYVEYMWS